MELIVQSTKSAKKAARKPKDRIGTLDSHNKPGILLIRKRDSEGSKIILEYGIRFPYHDKEKHEGTLVASGTFNLPFPKGGGICVTDVFMYWSSMKNHLKSDSFHLGSVCETIFDEIDLNDITFVVHQYTGHKVGRLCLSNLHFYHGSNLVHVSEDTCDYAGYGTSEIPFSVFDGNNFSYLSMLPNGRLKKWGSSSDPFYACKDKRERLTKETQSALVQKAIEAGIFKFFYHIDRTHSSKVAHAYLSSIYESASVKPFFENDDETINFMVEIPVDDFDTLATLEYCYEGFSRYFAIRKVGIAKYLPPFFMRRENQGFPTKTRTILRFTIGLSMTYSDRQYTQTKKNCILH